MANTPLGTKNSKGLYKTYCPLLFICVSGDRCPAITIKLFLAEVDLNRHSREIILLADMILQKSAIVLADILREVAEERKLRGWGWQLHCVLDANILTLHGWWWGVLDNWQDKVVELRGWDAA